MLILLLGVPVFLFTIGKVGLTHHFSLPIYHAETTNEQGDTVYHVVQNITGVTDKGVDFSLNDDLNEKYYIAGFYEQECINDCHKMLSQVKKILDVYENEQNFRIVLFTNCTPKKAIELREEYGWGNQLILAINGDSTLNSYARESFYIKNIALKGTNAYERKMVLVDKENHIRGFYKASAPKQIDRLITEVGILKKEYEE